MNIHFLSSKYMQFLDCLLFLIRPHFIGWLVGFCADEVGLKVVQKGLDYLVLTILPFVVSVRRLPRHVLKGRHKASYRHS